MMKRKVVAFLGTCMFFLGGAFFSQGADQKTANPYERALASNFFAQDAVAWDCGECYDDNGYLTCYDPGNTSSACEVYMTPWGSIECDQESDPSCSF